MISFREGTIVILYIPFDVVLTDIQKTQIENILFENQWGPPHWDNYNTMFEGYVIEDNTEEGECMEMLNEDDHMEAYFEVQHIYEDVTEKLRVELGNDDVMLCRGSTGYCDLDLAC